MYQKAASMSTWKEAIYAFIKGPGWFPGTPRLGDPMGVPEVVKSEFNSMCFIKINFSNHHEYCTIRHI